MNNRRIDDGSQEWFDGITTSRIRRQPMQNDGLSQYKKIITQDVDINQIQDPELRRRLVNAKEAGILAKEHYTNSPHYGPAHFGGKNVDRTTAMNYEINADVDGMSSAIISRQMQFRNELNEADTTEMQLQRLQPQYRNQASQALTALQNGQRGFSGSLVNLNEVNFNGRNNQPNNLNQQQQSNSNYQSCKLLNGYPCFRAMQGATGFGNTIIMARALGQINEQVSRYDFVVKGMVNVYIVQPQQTMVDVNKIQPNMLIQLIELVSPPMSNLGNLLVQKEAIAMENGYGRKQVIMDSRTHQNNIVNQGRQILNNSVSTISSKPASRLLKG